MGVIRLEIAILATVMAETLCRDSKRASIGLRVGGTYTRPKPNMRVRVIFLAFGI